MFYGWYIVISCFVISFFVAGTAVFGFTAVIDPIVAEFGWSYTQISIASSLRGLESGLLVPIIGIFMDRIGPRRLVFSGAVTLGLGMILLSRASNLAFFYGATIIVGIGLSTMPTMLLNTIVANWFKKKSGLAMGIAAAGVALGGFLVPAVTYVIDQYGWRQAMFLIGISAWIALIPLSLVLRHRPEQYGLLPDGKLFKPAPDEESTSSVNQKKEHMTVKEMAGSWPFFIISFTFLLGALPISAVTIHIMPYYNSIGVSRATASIIASATPLMTIVGRIGCGWLSDKMDKRLVMFLANISLGIGVLILPFITADRIWLTPLFLLFYAAGYGGTVPMMAILAKGYFGGRYLSTIVGFIGGALMVGMFVGGPVAGWVFDQWGAYQPVWFVYTGLVFFVAVVFIVGLKNRPVE